MKIELHPNVQKDPNLLLTRRVIEKLKNNGASLWLPEPFSLAIDGINEGYCPCPDMLIVLGGDGSIMRAAHRASVIAVPILGINLGRVGYLAELDPEDLDCIDDIFAKNYRIERRMMIETAVLRGGVEQGERRIALNDVVLSHGRLSHLLETEVICDGNSLGHYRSDGFIVSTPTGSTAYSLSAGGPVLAPSLRGICLTPICPHSLVARPIIVPEDANIEIRYLCPSDVPAHLTVDGVLVAELFPFDGVLVSRSAQTADFVRLSCRKEKGFYDILREKMSEI